MSSLAHAETSINRILISVQGSGKWITVRTSFYNVSSGTTEKIFSMGIDGNLETGEFPCFKI